MIRMGIGIFYGVCFDFENWRQDSYFGTNTKYKRLYEVASLRLVRRNYENN